MEPEVNGGGFEVGTLFPDIFDEVTFGEIVPKLPWKCFGSLAAVSAAWRQAIRSREVHDVRVIYNALESLVLLRCAPIEAYDVGYETLGLFSTRNGFYFHLPPLPGCERGIPSHRQCVPLDGCQCVTLDGCQCVTLDGKIYALGGKHLEFLRMYVLDLAAGPRQWKQCASMLREKKFFNCAALDGKVYVLGTDNKSARVTEVYDPEADTWSLIEPMPFRRHHGPRTSVREALPVRKKLDDREVQRELLLLRYVSCLKAVGEELFVITIRWAAHLFTRIAEVYHPGREEWRLEKFNPWEGDPDESSAFLFTAKGKLYRMKAGYICVLQMDTKTWMFRHHYSFAGIAMLDDLLLPGCVTAVGNELLAVVHRSSFHFLLRSEGFGGEDIDVQWHKSNIGMNLIPVSCLTREIYSIEL